MNNLLIILLVFSVLIACNKSDRVEVIKYHPNGRIEIKAYEKKGKPGNYDGLMLMYYESGNIQTEANWKDGLLDGEVKHFYENGKIDVININKNGKSVSKKKYFEDGHIEENFYDDKEVLIDYNSFNADGTRDFKVRKRDVLFNTDHPFDTACVGDFDILYLRLPNREFKKYEFVVGTFPNNKSILAAARLEKMDSVTGVLRIEGKKVGFTEVQGYALEFVERNDTIIGFRGIPFAISCYFKDCSKTKE